MNLVKTTKHLDTYKKLAQLAIKYGRSDLVKDIGFDDSMVTETRTVDDVDVIPPNAEQFAADLEALGPTYIKFGQLLSTRADLIPAEYAAALVRLQDHVEPLEPGVVEGVFTEQIGAAPKDVFASFDPEPLASASLGQVHAAVLRSDNRAVVVKVQRPGIREQIESDLEALHELASFMDDHTEYGARVGFVDLLDQFERTISQELDYQQEATSLSRMAEIVADYDHIVVPEPIPDFCASKVITMERIAGKKITDIGPLGQLDLNGEVLADELFRAYLDQILVHGFFHADPHPGNVFITETNKIALIDLGMVARIPESMQSDLIRLLIAVSAGKGEQAARTAIKMGRELPGFDEHQFVRNARDLVTKNYSRGVGQLDAGVLVMELTDISRRAGLRLPAELSMLGKTLLNLDQVVRTLDSDINPAETVRSHAESILTERMRPSSESLMNTMLDAREFFEELPGRVNKIMDATANGELRLNVDAIDEKELLVGIQKVANRITLGLLLAALIVGASMLARVDTGSELFGYPPLAIVAFLLAALGATALGVSILRSDRKRH